MRKIGFISVFLMMTAAAFADEPSLRPESSIPTPAEESVVSEETPALGAKESKDWLRLREERRMAREQILQELRSSSAEEKQSIRKEVAKNRARSNFEGEMLNNSRERQPNYEWQNQPMMPMREDPYGPPPPYEEEYHFHH